VAEVQITPLGNGVYRIVDGERTRVAYATGSPDERWVFIDGRVYVVDVSDSSSPVTQPLRAARRRDHSGDLSAPMPATVVTIAVEPGQRVSRGDVLIMLEAMKMELPIRAPRDGVVKSIACRAGELVQPGTALLELE
jgi:biotin carboxyl carrier protein